MTHFAAAFLRGALRAYQLCISPLLGANCRFIPRCSEYAREAIARHGAVGGVGLALRRVGRCHPWHPGGFDPVPEGGARPGVPPAGARPHAAPRGQLARRPG